MIPDLRAYYKDRFATYDDSLAAVQHGSREGQEARFRLLSRQIYDSDTVIDIGCGFGDFLPFLRQGGFKGQYIGLDFVEEFIAVAKDRNRDEDAHFEVFNVLGPKPLPQADYAVQSGIFNNAMGSGENRRLLETTLTKMAESTRKGFAFNFLSTYVEFTDPTLFYFDPGEVLGFCRPLAPFVSLRHDYVLKNGGFPYEVTVYASMAPIPI